MPISLFIDGAEGTTGLEIRQRLSGRNDIALILLGEEERKDVQRRRAALNDADFAILCLPDAAARDAVAMIANDRTRVIDASSAHRTAPDWTYGFAELSAAQQQRIAGAKRVSNPGCYPTGFLALLAPLVARGLLPADWPYSCHAVSGYSGGGKALIARFETEGDIAYRAYGLDLTHKHVPEMRVHAGLTRDPLFAPAVINAHRGMLVEIPLPLSAIPGAAGAAEIRCAWADHYAGQPLINLPSGDVPPELLIRQGTAATDTMSLYLAASADGAQARAIATIDNLCKGASGAAIHNLNIMAGFAPLAGLRL
jgi:N-acetyl-gamma-glutamyl-phosphate reductase